MKGIKYIFFFLLIASASFSQDEQKVFSLQDFTGFVTNFHPVVRQANLLTEVGERSLQASRGGFDPYLFGDYDQKWYANKEYYGILGSGLKVPTWYGIELKSGFDQNSGILLNPENNVPDNGLWYAGISVPVGQGLFIDKRRAALKQAQVFEKSTQAERLLALNDLYFDGIQQYWKWVEAWNLFKIYDESVQLAYDRYLNVKQSHKFGDLPAIDTLEAYLQYQNRLVFRNEYQLIYRNTTLELSNYLWFDDSTPLEITDSLRPPLLSELQLSLNLPDDSLNSWLNNLALNHPAMQLYNYKLESIDIERRLKTEALKPKINLNYNLLSDPDDAANYGTLSTENYKWGLEFGIPIFLRGQRGQLKLTELKFMDTELEQNQKLLELRNKVRYYRNEQVVLREQVELYRDVVNNYSRMLSGEKQKFEAGESSLFLVNTREIRLISAQLKLIELVSKYNRANSGIFWASGLLYRL